MKQDPHFKFSQQQRSDIKATLQKYFSEELEVEIGSLQADILVDFLDEHVGRHYYNLGVTDAMTVLKEKTEDLVMLMKD